MSFYNVQNPINFSNFNGNAKRIAPLSSLTTVPKSQFFDSPPSIDGLLPGQFSVSQILSGSLVIQIAPFHGTTNFFLPKPQDLLAGLRNSSLNENNSIAAGDMICLNVAISKYNTSTIDIYGVDRDNNAGGSVQFINPQPNFRNSFDVLTIQFYNVNEGQEGYNVL